MTPSPRRRRALVDHFEAGLDAPICLTWELTYACNLACVHCLSSSGPARPARAVDRRVQGGHRRARSGCRSSTSTSAAASRRSGGTSGSCVDYADGARRRREVLDQRRRGSRRRSPRGWPPATTSTCRSRSTARRPRSTTRVRGAGSYATAIARDGAPRATPASRASRSRSSSPARTSASSTRSRRSPTATARSCGSRGCGRRGAAPTSGTSCTRPPRSSAQLYDWLLAHGEDVLTGDSFFHLAALRRAAARASTCAAPAAWSA